MKIQYISNNNQRFTKFVCSTIGNPEAFDSFDINIIDLTDSHVWTCNERNLTVIDYKKDFNNLRNIILKSKCQNIIFFFL